MRATNHHSLLRQVLQGAMLAVGSLFALASQAAAPGITGPTFNLTAGDMHISQPNGRSVYTWGYGCNGTPAGFVPASIAKASCPAAQLPGPTLVVTEGQQVTVTLTNNLPAAAGATSILFPGFNVATIGGTTGVLTQEAPSAAACVVATNPGCNTVTYTFTPPVGSAGTHSYYSGTQADLQIEMGLFGALIVLPATIPASCDSGIAAQNLAAKAQTNEGDFRLAHAAYNHAAACYDREYLFQFSEMNDNVHLQAESQVVADQQAKAAGGTGCTTATGCLVVATEPYTPGYFLINGRSMPDDMDGNYAEAYPNQPYNGNPHMHPGELTLIRIIGQGRWQHPFHEHANHVRIIARDGNPILSPPIDANGTTLPAGPLMFTTTTTPGLAMDGIFSFTGKGLNWDMYGHGTDAAGQPVKNTRTGQVDICIPDVNGYYTSNPLAPNYYEWCGDHGKALEKNPTGEVASGGPMTLPEPTIVANGTWYSGSPYFGSEATGRAVGATPLPVVGVNANDPGKEAGWAYMWHSHNEREITTDNVFPGGMMMMMLVDPRDYAIDESN